MYVDVDFADEYHNARQSADVWRAFDDKARRLMSASDLIDRMFDYKGVALDEIRAFPRVIDNEPPKIPLAVKHACCELALLNDISGALPNASKLRQIGAVVLKNEDCTEDDVAQAISLQLAVRMLMPFVEYRRNVRLMRG